MKNTKISKLALAIGVVVMAGSAMATDSGTGSMDISATISPECSVGTLQELAFGTLSMLANGAVTTADSPGTATFDAICTNGAPSPKFKFVSINTSDGTDFRLQGTDTTTYITYSLKDSANTPITPNTEAAFGTFAADGITQNLTLNGTIAAADKSAKKVQAYSDIITITTSYTP
jgi:spore coat protein U-like protein